MSNAEAGYFAAEWDATEELARLRMLEQVCDPQTIRHLTDLGVDDGWRCLEVGAGAGSIVRWFSDRIGPTGHVVAADIDPRFLGDFDAANVEIRQCDVTRDPLEADSYDLIHARAMIMHLRAPLDVLQLLVAALRPGGWLLIEDPDYELFRASHENHPLAAAFNTLCRTRIEFLAKTGVMDLRYGNTLPIHIEQLGLGDIGNAGTTYFEHGGGVLSQFLSRSFAPLDAAMAANEVLSEQVVADGRRALDDPTFLYRGGLMVAVWGRKPV